MKEIKHSERGHCELSPSGSKRWIACPGSIRLSRGIERATSVHAAEGTAAHELGERCLRHGADTNEFQGMVINDFEVTEEMVEAVQVYVDYCRSLPAEQCWIEQQITLSPLNPPANMWGTADFVAIGHHDPDIDGRTLYVVDLKYGKGVLVEVEGNTQLLYYGLGAYLTSTFRREIKRVVVAIVQPRAPHVGGPVRSIEYSVDDLVDFAVDILQAADAALADDAPLFAGPHCRWCPAEASCPEQMKAMQELAQIEFAVPARTAPQPHELTTEQLRTVLARKNEIVSWLASVEQYARTRLVSGSELTGFKLVNTRPRRAWAQSEQETDKALRAMKVKVGDMYERSLRSPAQIEKVAKVKIPEHLTIKVSTGVTIAPLSDPRPEVKMLSGADEFEPVVDEPEGDE